MSLSFDDWIKQNVTPDRVNILVITEYGHTATYLTSKMFDDEQFMKEVEKIFFKRLKEMYDEAKAQKEKF